MAHTNARADGAYWMGFKENKNRFDFSTNCENQRGLNVLNKYQLTVIVALVHRQMHLLESIRFHCTTKADHAIDLSP